MKLFEKILTKIKVRWDTLVNLWRLQILTRRVANVESQVPHQKGGVVVFNASTRLGNLSLNAAYSALMSWGLRVSGRRVTHFVCQAGMSRCLLGSSEEDPDQLPPCSTCTAFSDALFAKSDVFGFHYQLDAELITALENQRVPDLYNFSFHGIPLGEIVLPSVRWRMRRHHLEDDRTTRILFKEFILSAHQVGKSFAELLDKENPAAVIVFNGQMFPEAMARYVAKERGLTVFSHEIGLQPNTVFITKEDATARRVFLSEEELNLTEKQDARLEQYLEKRFQGRFSMGGIQFWKDMQGLSEEIQAKMGDYRQMVPVFTNVIFDTSQAHANVAFDDMFVWLDEIRAIILDNPDTLFVIRAHPDEMRPNSNKQSRETVAAWVNEHRVADLPNVVFVDSLQYISSYELVHHAKFVLAYNSSIALESALLGKLPVCAGWSWYADYPTGVFPKTQQDYRQQVAALLQAEQVDVPEEYRKNARSLIYYQNYRSSVPLGEYLEPHAILGYVRFKVFDPQELSAQNNLAIKLILESMQNSQPVVVLAEE